MSLKRELTEPGSPIRRFLDDRLPNADRARAPWGAALRQVPPLLPPPAAKGESVPGAAIGHALQARVVWDFVLLDDPAYLQGGALLVDAGASPVVVDDLLARLAEPRPGDPDRAARLAWFAGVLDRAQRTGRTDDVTALPVLNATELPALLAAAPDLWVGDVVAVAEVAEEPLESLRGPGARARVPVSGGAPFGGVEAELIARDTLVDLSATTSAKARARDLELLVVTALLDLGDELGITEVAVAPLRFGALIQWDLVGLLGELADREVAVEDLRAELAERLRA